MALFLRAQESSPPPFRLQNPQDPPAIFSLRPGSTFQPELLRLGIPIALSSGGGAGEESPPRCLRLFNLNVAEQTKTDMTGTLKKPCSGTFYTQSTTFSRRCWTSLLVRSHITHSMSKKPAFTGLWKCFRRVCLCNYEVNSLFCHCRVYYLLCHRSESSNRDRLHSGLYRKLPIGRAI